MLLILSFLLKILIHINVIKYINCMHTDDELMVFPNELTTLLNERFYFHTFFVSNFCCCKIMQ